MSRLQPWGSNLTRWHNRWRFDVGKQKAMGSDVGDMMHEERFGFLSSTDDGNTLFADIPLEAVSSYCRYGLLTLPDDDDDNDGRINGVAQGKK
jgi:hypothetical protein